MSQFRIEGVDYADEEPDDEVEETDEEAELDECYSCKSKHCRCDEIYDRMREDRLED